MTLFIACLLIYHYGVAWWWYGIATLVWLAHLALMSNLYKS
jgi:hypothetical protein